MEVLYFISLIVFFIYTVAIISAYGVLPSVSDSAYRLREDGLEPFFSIFGLSVCFPLLIFWLSVSPGPLPFIACSGLMFVGVSPKFKDTDLEKKVHFSSAFVCMAGAYAWTFLCGNIVLGLVAVVLSIVLLFVKNRLYWIETVAFLNIYVQLPLLFF